MNVRFYLLFIGLYLTSCQDSIPSESASNPAIISHTRSLPENLSTIHTKTEIIDALYMYIHANLLSLNLHTHQLDPILLAEIPTYSEDNKQLSCTLHPDAQFDDQSPVTSQDVIFSLKTYACEGIINSSNSENTDNILDIKEVDETHFTIIYDNPSIQSLYSLGEFPILQASKYDSSQATRPYSFDQLKNGYDKINDPALTEWVNTMNGSKFSTDKRNIFGAGPYKITEWEETHLTLSKKNDHWHKNPTAPDQLIFKLSSDFTAKMLDLKAQAVDVSVGYSSSEILQLKEDTGITNHYDIQSVPVYSHTLISLNIKSDMADRHPYFDDPKVRKSMAYLLPIQKAMNKLSNGTAIRIASPIAIAKEEHHTELNPYDYDLSKAQGLLSEAGWSDSDMDGVLDKKIDGELVPFKITLLCPPSELIKALSSIFVEGIRAAKIDIEVESPDDWRQRLMESHNFDMALLSVSNAPGPNYPLNMYLTDQHPQGINFSGYSNPVIDSLSEEVTVTIDLKERKKLLFEIQEILYDELPYLYISTGKRGLAIHKKFNNPKLSGISPFVNLDQLTYSKSD